MTPSHLSVHTLTREELVRSLVSQGVPREKAERAVDQRTGGWMKRPPRAIAEPDPAPAITWPLQLTLPWSYLASDNAKHGAVLVQVAGGKLIPKLIMQAGYREAKTKIRKLARDTIAGAEPVAIPLRLEARVWVPDTTRKHDVANFAKCTHDALQEAIYTDDQYLYDVRWIRAGVDVDRPRADVTIMPLPGAP